MNVLFLTTHFNTGGITSYILTLGDALVQAGHKVVVVSGGGDCESMLEKAGIRHVRANIRTKSEIHPKLLFSLSLINNLIAGEEIQIIHAQTRVTQVLAAWVSRMSGVKTVTTCHGFFKPRWFRKVFPCWGEAVIAISKPVAQHLREDLKVPANKIRLIANGIDLDRFSVTDDIKRKELRKGLNIGDSPLIGVIARLSDVKGIDVLIQAMPLVLKSIPSVKLLIAGRGPEEAELKKLTQNLSLMSRVIFKDTVGKTSDLLGAFDVFAMPSLMEGLGLSVMEAQACGIPVVASRVGGLVDLIEDGKSGYLVAPGDPAALSERIIKVLEDPSGAQRMAQQARANIERHFSAGLMAQKTIEIYEQYSRR